MRGTVPQRLRLHGYAVSNYFNIVRAALIEKEAAFEIVETRASQARQFLAVSPMGKIPVLETPEGWIAETVAILEYLEELIESPPLHPADRFLRARGRQIINVVQMYVEAPARTLYPGVFMGGSNSEETVAAARAVLDRSTGALARLVRPEPFLLGPALTFADLFTFYCLDLVDRVTRFVYDRSIIEEVDGLGEWRNHMAVRKSSQTVLADFQRAFTEYLRVRQAAYDPTWESGRRPGDRDGTGSGAA